MQLLWLPLTSDHFKQDPEAFFHCSKWIRFQDSSKPWYGPSSIKPSHPNLKAAFRLVLRLYGSFHPSCTLSTTVRAIITISKLGVWNERKLIKQVEHLSVEPTSLSSRAVYYVSISNVMFIYSWEPFVQCKVHASKLTLSCSRDIRRGTEGLWWWTTTWSIFHRRIFWFSWHLSLLWLRIDFIFS